MVNLTPTKATRCVGSLGYRLQTGEYRGFPVFVEPDGGVMWSPQDVAAKRPDDLVTVPADLHPDIRPTYKETTFVLFDPANRAKHPVTRETLPAVYVPKPRDEHQEGDGGWTAFVRRVVSVAYPDGTRVYGWLWTDATRTPLVVRKLAWTDAGGNEISSAVCPNDPPGAPHRFHGPCTLIGSDKIAIALEAK